MERKREASNQFTQTPQLESAGVLVLAGTGPTVPELRALARCDVTGGRRRRRPAATGPGHDGFRDSLVEYHLRHKDTRE